MREHVRQEVGQFIEVTAEFARIMRHNFAADEEANLRLLADKSKATVGQVYEREAGSNEWHPMGRNAGWTGPRTVMCKTEGCSNPAYRGIYCLECKGWCSA